MNSSTNSETTQEKTLVSWKNMLDEIIPPEGPIGKETEPLLKRFYQNTIECENKHQNLNSTPTGASNENVCNTSGKDNVTYSPILVKELNIKEYAGVLPGRIYCESLTVNNSCFGPNLEVHEIAGSSNNYKSHKFPSCVEVFEDAVSVNNLATNDQVNIMKNENLLPLCNAADQNLYNLNIQTPSCIFDTVKCNTLDTFDKKYPEKMLHLNEVYNELLMNGHFGELKDKPVAKSTLGMSSFTNKDMALDICKTRGLTSWRNVSLLKGNKVFVEKECFKMNTFDLEENLLERVMNVTFANNNSSSKTSSPKLRKTPAITSSDIQIYGNQCLEENHTFKSDEEECVTNIIRSENKEINKPTGLSSSIHFETKLNDTNNSTPQKKVDVLNDPENNLMETCNFSECEKMTKKSLKLKVCATFEYETYSDISRSPSVSTYLQYEYSEVSNDKNCSDQVVPTNCFNLEKDSETMLKEPLCASATEAIKTQNTLSESKINSNASIVGNSSCIHSSDFTGTLDRKAVNWDLVNKFKYSLDGQSLTDGILKGIIESFYVPTSANFYSINTNPTVDKHIGSKINQFNLETPGKENAETNTPYFKITEGRYIQDQTEENKENDLLLAMNKLMYLNNGSADLKNDYLKIDSLKAHPSELEFVALKEKNLQLDYEPNNMTQHVLTSSFSSDESTKNWTLFEQTVDDNDLDYVNDFKEVDDEIDKAIDNSILKYENFTVDKSMLATPNTSEKSSQTNTIWSVKNKLCKRCLKFEEEEDHRPIKKSKFVRHKSAEDILCYKSENQKNIFPQVASSTILSSQNTNSTLFTQSPKHVVSYRSVLYSEPDKVSSQLFNMEIEDTDEQSDYEVSLFDEKQKPDVDSMLLSMSNTGANRREVYHQVPSIGQDSEMLKQEKGPDTPVTTPKKPVLRVGLSRSVQLKPLHPK